MKNDQNGKCFAVASRSSDSLYRSGDDSSYFEITRQSANRAAALLINRQICSINLFFRQRAMVQYSIVGL